MTTVYLITALAAVIGALLGAITAPTGKATQRAVVGCFFGIGAWLVLYQIAALVVLLVGG